MPSPGNFTAESQCADSRALVQWIESDDDLAALASDWDALAGDVPFRTWQWMECWWRHYRTSRDRLCVLAVRDLDERLIGVVPWYLHRGPSGRRAVRFLGSGEVCADYLSLVCDPGDVDRIAHAAANWLEDAAVDWDVVELLGVEAGDAAVVALCRQMAERGSLVDRASDGNCWSVTLGDDWGEYLARLSRTRRERTRSILRKTFDKGRARQHVAVDTLSLERAFATLVELHQRRRNSLGEPGCFASRRFTAFHRELAGRMLAVGRLRLVWTELDGRAVAAEYDFVGDRSVYFYQSGFEPDAADIRPGWMGIAASLRWAIEQGMDNFDFLRGDEPYKASWGAVARPLMQYRVVNSRASSRMRHRAWLACRRLKRWASRGRQEK